MLLIYSLKFVSLKLQGKDYEKLFNFNFVCSYKFKKITDYKYLPINSCTVL